MPLIIRKQYRFVVARAMQNVQNLDRIPMDPVENQVIAMGGGGG